MAQQLRLFVFVIGLETFPFSVTIKSSEIVDDLKRSIVELKPNDLKGVDADRLALYKVELAGDETLGQLAAQAVKKDVPLLPYSPLSKIFPAGPPKEKINIIVDISNISE